MVAVLDVGQRVEGYSTGLDVMMYLVRLQRITQVECWWLVPETARRMWRRMEQWGITADEVTRWSLETMGILQVERYVRWTSRLKETRKK